MTHKLMSLQPGTNSRRELVLDNVVQVLTVRFDTDGEPIAFRIYQRGVQVKQACLAECKMRGEWKDSEPLPQLDFDRMLWLAVRTTMNA